MLRNIWTCFILAVFFGFTGYQSVMGQKKKENVFKDFKQLLQRGQIAAVFSPKFVKADKARIRPEAWILGFVKDGQARAYSLNLLNSHEVVNDKIGSLKFAAVW